MERYPKLNGKLLGIAIKNFKNDIIKNYSSLNNLYKNENHMKNHMKNHMYISRINEMDEDMIWNIFEKVN